MAPHLYSISHHKTKYPASGGVFVLPAKCKNYCLKEKYYTSCFV
jgi:hypothetical protein